MIYLDTSVVLAQLFAEDRAPPAAFWSQTFVASRAADYKVPKKILFMDEIPKGATGKLQRIGLAQKLGLGSA